MSDWHAYVLRTLDDLRALSRLGFAFNVLTGTRKQTNGARISTMRTR